MRKLLSDIFRFLPVQLFFLHFRKYQLFLVFWIILVLTITGDFAAVFGASTLFLSPEYLGQTGFWSMFLMGGALAIFVMSWHITTFIINNKRLPFLGAIRFAFIKYCINNSLIPFSFLVFYTISSIRFQLLNEHATGYQVFMYQLGFYLGFTFIILLSFAYFFRVGKDLLKEVVSSIAPTNIIKDIIPFDSLDTDDYDIIKANSFIDGNFRIKKFSEVSFPQPRLLRTVLRRHSRNATTAAVFAIILLIISGLLSEQPMMRVPAAASFLLLFAVIMGLVGSIKHLLRSWEILGWIVLILFFSFLVKEGVMDLRSKAYGLKYESEKGKKLPYNYQQLTNVFDKDQYYADKQQEQQRLNNWKQKFERNKKKPVMVVVAVSGGGSRAAFWAFRALQYTDSVTHGSVFNNCVMVTGASGGMMGAAYWRVLNDQYKADKINNIYSSDYQTNVAKDLLNSIIFSLASVDMVSPFNKISLAGYSYHKDRGYAMEQEMIRNTNGALDLKLSDLQNSERSGQSPMFIINGTIINDGRRLMMSAQPLGYLTQSEYDLKHSDKVAIDAVDFATYFKDYDPYNLRLTTALRMTATFPYILPIVRLPSEPNINVMDAGLRDNFGMELSNRYVHTMRDWIMKNTSKVVVLQIRDTRAYEVFPPSNINTLSKVITTPLFVIHNKWEPFQSYWQGYTKDYLKDYFGDQLEYITLQYIPEKRGKTAALNFHVTAKEQEDLLQSIYNETNKKEINKLSRILNGN